MIIDHIGRLDSENRETVFELILCHPFAGHLAREYLDFQAMRGATAESAALELIAWLLLAREACGVAGVGHAQQRGAQSATWHCRPAPVPCAAT